jgi:hypothetical protein
MKWVAAGFVAYVLVCAVGIGACHHDATPVEPAGTPPLPPSSGTPIGYLVDEAAALHLDDAQVAKLREIDTSLAADLEAIDAQTRSANRPAPDPDQQQSPPSGGRRGRRGGMGGGSMGGSSGGHRHRRGGGTGSGSGTSPQVAAGANRLAEQRAGDVREALKRAFALLDATQQAAATKVLAAHDVDLDADVTGTALPASGSDETDADPPPEP